MRPKVQHWNDGVPHCILPRTSPIEFTSLRLISIPVTVFVQFTPFVIFYVVLILKCSHFFPLSCYASTLLWHPWWNHLDILNKEKNSDPLLEDDQVRRWVATFRIKLKTYKFTKDFNLEILIEKAKIMDFQGKYPARSKLYIQNKITEQVSSSKYLGYWVTHKNEKDTAEKITNREMGVINQGFKPKFLQKHTGIRVHTLLSRSVLTYGSEAWMICKR
jgi:hypothetical protein